MKKIIALVLTLTLAFSMSMAAFADASNPQMPTPSPYPNMSTVQLTKTYFASDANAISPEETFTFSKLECVSVTDAASGITAETINADSTSTLIPTIGSTKFIEGGATTQGNSQPITITLPTNYPSVGIYKYQFNEIAGTTAGVTYRPVEDKIFLVVTVVEQDGLKRVAAVHTESNPQPNSISKSAEFNNTYSAGSLSVSKTVTGLLGDKLKEFAVTVTFNAPEGKIVQSNISYSPIGATEPTVIPGGWEGTKEVNISLKDSSTVTFTNIPYGVTYSIKEDAEVNLKTPDNYAVTYDEYKSGEINNATTSSTIINDKGGEVDTGISMDSIPYIVLLIVACVGVIVLVSKKRVMRDF